MVSLLTLLVRVEIELGIPATPLIPLETEVNELVRPVTPVDTVLIEEVIVLRDWVMAFRVLVIELNEL